MILRHWLRGIACAIALLALSAAATGLATWPQTRDAAGPTPQSERIVVLR